MDKHEQSDIPLSASSLVMKKKSKKNRIKNKNTKPRNHSSTASSHNDIGTKNTKNMQQETRNDKEEEEEQEYLLPVAKKRRLTEMSHKKHGKKRDKCVVDKNSNRNVDHDDNEDDLINPSIEISRPDHDATLKLLKSMDWTMAKNTSRRNVIREDDKSTPRNEMGKPYCMSFIFGRNMKDPNGSLSYWSTKYPNVYSELQNLISKYDPKFPYTHITLNYNLQCKRHTDGGNVGPSYIAAFGDFQGGELIVEVNRQQKRHGNKGENGAIAMDKYLNLKSRFVKFNGKTQPHETAPFTGERFTLVYYTSDIVPPMIDRRRRQVSSSANPRSLPSSGHMRVVQDGSENGLNPKSVMAQKFQAIKAKLGQRNKKRI